MADTQNIYRMVIVFPAGDGAVDLAATRAKGGLQWFTGDGGRFITKSRFQDSDDPTKAWFSGVSEVLFYSLCGFVMWLCDAAL